MPLRRMVHALRARAYVSLRIDFPLSDRSGWFRKLETPVSRGNAVKLATPSSTKSQEPRTSGDPQHAIWSARASLDLAIRRLALRRDIWSPDSRCERRCREICLFLAAERSNSAPQTLRVRRAFERRWRNFHGPRERSTAFLRLARRFWHFREIADRGSNGAGGARERRRTAASRRRSKGAQRTSGRLGRRGRRLGLAAGRPSAGPGQREGRQQAEPPGERQVAHRDPTAAGEDRDLDRRAQALEGRRRSRILRRDGRPGGERAGRRMRPELEAPDERPLARSESPAGHLDQGELDALRLEARHGRSRRRRLGLRGLGTEGVWRHGSFLLAKAPIRRGSPAGGNGGWRGARGSRLEARENDRSAGPRGDREDSQKRSFAERAAARIARSGARSCAPLKPRSVSSQRQQVFFRRCGSGRRVFFADGSAWRKVFEMKSSLLPMRIDRSLFF